MQNSERLLFLYLPMSKNNGNTAPALSDKAYLKSGRARKLPIYACYITKGWKEEGICNVLIIRKHVNNNVSFGHFMVDIWCTGVKSTSYNVNKDISILDPVFNNTELPMIEISYELAHNIIYSALAYAEEYDIKPHKDFELTRLILEEDDDKVELIEIECGKDGKPFLVVVNSQDSRNNYYYQQLLKNAGEGNFDYLVSPDVIY